MSDLLFVDEIIAGDTLDFVTEVEDFPPSDGYTARYYLTPRESGGVVITITASPTDDDKYRVVVSPTVTATWPPGEYGWTGRVEKAGDTRTFGDGLSLILPDVGQVTSYDRRTQAQKALDDCRTALASFSANDSGRVKRYAIAGREMEFESRADIVKEISYWTNAVRLENRAKALREGQADPSRVFVRLGRA